MNKNVLPIDLVEPESYESGKSKRQAYSRKKEKSHN